ncbi:hypothetical protein [Lysinibacillus sp. NPDC056220]|uniref:hypothetical protein n=1 Tax=Lysinibacillus sp. NPDC056220 TaxID=3398580 RepID=UPI003BF4D69A|nr:hypothetical protein OL548_07010 [Lysinibacillus sp. MHQ-1]
MDWSGEVRHLQTTYRRKELFHMNSDSKEDFTDSWWFLGICAAVAVILTLLHFNR